MAESIDSDESKRQQWRTPPARNPISSFRPNRKALKQELLRRRERAEPEEPEDEEPSERIAPPPQIASAEKRFEKRNRATKGTFILMLIVAIFFDAVQFGLDAL